MSIFGTETGPKLNDAELRISCIHENNTGKNTTSCGKQKQIGKK